MRFQPPIRAASGGAVLATVLTACTSGTPSSDAVSNGVVYSLALTVSGSSSLPACTTKTEGETAIVTSTATLEACEQGKWVEIPCNAASSGDVAYDSAVVSLWACTMNLDGGTPRWAQITLPQGPPGPQGEAGPQGPAGSAPVITLTPIPPGATCPAGGTEVQIVVDGGVAQSATICSGTTLDAAALDAGNADATVPIVDSGSLEEGDGSPADLVASVTSLTFGVTCDAPAPPAQTFSLTNEGGTAVTWTAEYVSGLSVSPTSSTLAPGASVTLSVAVPAEEADGGTLFSSTETVWGMSIETPTQLLQVLVTSEIEGCIWVADTLPTNVDFGDVTVGSTAYAFVGTPSISCNGASSAIALSGPVPGTSPFEVVTGEGATPEISFSPTVAGTQSAEFTFVNEFTVSLCGASAQFSATGTGVAVDAGPDE